MSVSGTRERKACWFHSNSVSELRLSIENNLWVATLNISSNNAHKIVTGRVSYYKIDLSFTWYLHKFALVCLWNLY